MRSFVLTGGAGLFLAAGGGAPASSSAFQARPGFCVGGGARHHRRRAPSFTAATPPMPATSLASSVTNAVNVQESAEGQRDVWSMEEWATNYGVQKAEGFQLTSEDGIDYSVVTNQNLPGGSPVVYVPGQMILSAERLGQEFGGSTTAGEEQLIRAGESDLVPLFRLFVKILAEYEMGDRSPYFPWLNSLPKRFNNGASMTRACFECLPPYAAALAMKEYQNFAKFRKALKFVRLSKSTVKNRTLKKWAYNVAVTRSFEVNGDRRIAPMADMFNHATDPEVEMNYDEQGNCAVYTTRDVPAGSSLRMSYGDPTNPSPLFATFGFLDESSPATFCKIMHLQDEMRALGLDYSNLLFYKDTGGISGEVWDVVLYDVLSFDEGLRENFYRAYVSGDTETKEAYHQEYFPFTLEALKQHVDGFLAELDALSAHAYTKDPAKHPRLPVILKHNEFVKSTFMAVKSQLDAM